jgi:putative GTP pyrophosphokinase
MKTPKPEIDSLEKEFNVVSIKCAELCNELTRQISTLITKANIRLAVPLQNRTKAWTSVLHKLNQKRFVPKKSVLEMQDLVGIRAIFLFKRDTEVMAELIKSNFKVLNEYNSQDKLNDDQFGYSSKHVVIELSDEWLKVPTMRDFAGIKCEIQIRTLSQHAWADASHILQYKAEENVPAPLKRTISRISALLEIVDLEFERILSERESYKENIEEIKLSKSSTEELNVDILVKIMDEKLPIQNKEMNEEY